MKSMLEAFYNRIRKGDITEASEQERLKTALNQLKNEQIPHQKFTLLMAAIESNSPKAVEIILASTPNLNLRDHTKRTALYHAVNKLAVAYENDETDINPIDGKFRMQKGESKDVKKEREAHIAKLKLSRETGLKILNQLLAALTPAEIAVKHASKTVLMIAAENGDTEVVKLILDRINHLPPASINAFLNDKEANVAGMTAYLLAVKKGHWLTAEAIRLAGADISLKSKKNEGALLIAVKAKELSVALKLLEQHVIVATINDKDLEGYTALLKAVMPNDNNATFITSKINLIRALLRHGADTSISVVVKAKKTKNGSFNKEDAKTNIKELIPEAQQARIMSLLSGVELADDETQDTTLATTTSSPESDEDKPLSNRIKPKSKKPKGKKSKGKGSKGKRVSSAAARAASDSNGSESGDEDFVHMSSEDASPIASSSHSAAATDGAAIPAPSTLQRGHSAEAADALLTIRTSPPGLEPKASTPKTMDALSLLIQTNLGQRSHVSTAVNGFQTTASFRIPSPPTLMARSGQVSATAATPLPLRKQASPLLLRPLSAYVSPVKSASHIPLFPANSPVISTSGSAAAPDALGASLYPHPNRVSPPTYLVSPSNAGSAMDGVLTRQVEFAKLFAERNKQVAQQRVSALYAQQTAQTEAMERSLQEERQRLNTEQAAQQVIEAERRKQLDEISQKRNEISKQLTDLQQAKFESKKTFEDQKKSQESELKKMLEHKRKLEDQASLLKKQREAAISALQKKNELEKREIDEYEQLIKTNEALLEAANIEPLTKKIRL